jgi:hypothetical protein
MRVDPTLDHGWGTDDVQGNRRSRGVFLSAHRHVRDAPKRPKTVPPT